MAAHDHTGSTFSTNETRNAILGSLVISIILATILVGSPFHAFAAAYSDYGKDLPSAKGSATPAPAPAPK